MYCSSWNMPSAMLHVHVHAACLFPYLFCTSMIMVHVHCTCCLYMSTLHVPVHAACPFLCFMK
jgi:hypothetical protein